MNTGRRSPQAVFAAFLWLGVTSFGGPIAHIGHFRTEFVERRRWLSDARFAELLALCQLLPGPASSQLGFGIGLTQAGPLGALFAFIAFTLPSALLLFAFATLLPAAGAPVTDAAFEGLKIVALAVVADGLVAMSRRLTPDWPRAGIATVAAASTLVVSSAWFQLAAITAGAAAGSVLLRDTPAMPASRIETGYGYRTALALLTLFVLLLSGLAMLGLGGVPIAASADAFYRAGALVFGGGHVVLPLLEETLVAPGWISADDFLAGYGAAQAVPGPMFTIATYLGALLPGPGGGIGGAAIATFSIFLPGFLLLAGILPLWQRLAERPAAARVVAGINAVVVGLLAAALYDPVFVSVGADPGNLAIAATGFLLLWRWQLSALIVVLWCVGARVAISLI